MFIVLDSKCVIDVIEQIFIFGVENMDMVKKIGKGIKYILTELIPNITFIVIFGTFLLTIISRYIFRTPITWSYEISILGYMWVMFFAVGKAMEADDHVVFGLVYDHLGKKGQVACKIIYNIMLIVLLGVTLIPSIQSLMSKKMMTGVLKLPFKVVFAPMIYMFAEIIVRSIIDIIRSIKGLKEPVQSENIEVS